MRLFVILVYVFLFFVFFFGELVVRFFRTFQDVRVFLSLYYICLGVWGEMNQLEVIFRFQKQKLWWVFLEFKDKRLRWQRVFSFFTLGEFRYFQEMRRGVQYSILFVLFCFFFNVVCDKQFKIRRKQERVWENSLYLLSRN